MPGGIPLQQTMYRDTPAPFSCPFCGGSSSTIVNSRLSLAAVIACMVPGMLGCCFLSPFMDCLWHKYHHCPACREQVGNFEKSDPCLIADVPRWKEISYAIPAS